MILERVGLIAVDSSRTRAYLAAITSHGLLPAHAILLSGGSVPGAGSFPAIPYFDNLTPALDTILRAGVPYEVMDTHDVNSPEVVSAVKASPVDIFIYSGPGGAILTPELLNAGKRFLHVHPGLLPRFRGSTTTYYSLLVDGNCGVSAIFLEEKIDSGPVLATQVYPPPEDRSTIDYGYDPYIRSDLLVQVLKDYQATGEFRARPQSTEPGETYFIAHPVLRHVAILSNRADPVQAR